MGGLSSVGKHRRRWSLRFSFAWETAPAFTVRIKQFHEKFGVGFRRIILHTLPALALSMVALVSIVSIKCISKSNTRPEQHMVSKEIMVYGHYRLYYAGIN
jgi:hypothetical protein